MFKEGLLGSDTVNTIRQWVKHVSDGSSNLKDMPRSDCLHTAAMAENGEKVDKLFHED
jgi:hypothetical protein